MVGPLRIVGTLRGFDEISHLFRGNHALLTVASTEFLKDLASLLDSVVFSFDANFAMPGEYLHPERVAYLSEKLVPAAEDSKFFVVTVETERNFRHASPF